MIFNSDPFEPRAPFAAHLVLVVSADPLFVEMVRPVITESGHLFHQAMRASEAIEAAKQLLPSVMLVDANLPRGDADRCVRVVRRCLATQAVVPILVFPPEYDRLKLECLLASGAHSAIVVSHDHLDALHAKLPQAMEHSEQLLTEMAKNSTRPPPATQRVYSNSSLLSRTMRCPFHETQQPFHRYMLRTGKILTETSFFDLPIYKQPVPGADPVNFHLLHITVCPVCLFASNNPGFFRDPSEKHAEEHAYDSSTIMAISAHADDRRKLAGDLPEDFFTEKRSLPQAILAHDLAIACCRILVDKNRYNLPTELVRLGNYHLRRAVLLEMTGRPTEDCDPDRQAALEALKQGFTVAEGTILFKATYQIIALAIYFGDDKTAFAYFSKLNEIDRDPALGKLDRMALLRYLPRCQKAWEDRDLNRAPGLAAA